MFLHIGGDVAVALRDVVAIVDARAAHGGSTGGDLLSAVKLGGARFASTEGEPSAYVVTTEAVYASSISPSTLRRRAQSPYSVREEGEADGGPRPGSPQPATGEERDKSDPFE